MRFIKPLIAGLLAACGAAAAHADISEIQWDGAGRFEKKLVVPPGKFAELCGMLSQDAKIDWSFKADESLNFNIHYHEGEKVVYPVKQMAIGASNGRLEVSSPQDYCWMWTNKGKSPVSLHVMLRR